MNLNEVKERLIKRGYKAVCFETAQECAEYLNHEIDGVTVGIGGSVTVTEMGLFPMLKSHNEVSWHNDPEQVKALGDMEIRSRAMDTEVYISSVNGMSEDGMIVNIDHIGNRIASMCFGHKKVYLIVGRNKIEKDLEKAVWRARNVASPQNAKRLNRKTPCAVKGDKCYDCKSPERICRGLLILERAMAGAETEILLVNEELGY